MPKNKTFDLNVRPLIAWLFAIMAGALLFAGWGPAPPKVNLVIAAVVAVVSLAIGVKEAMNNDESWLLTAPVAAGALLLTYSIRFGG